MSKYRIGPSSIHGQGIITKYTINKGEIIDKGIDYIWGLFPYITPYFGSWINHSNHANTQLCYLENGYYIMATQMIKKDEEVTVNYNMTPWYIENARSWYK